MVFIQSQCLSMRYHSNKYRDKNKNKIKRHLNKIWVSSMPLQYGVAKKGNASSRKERVPERKRHGPANEHAKYGYTRKGGKRREKDTALQLVTRLTHRPVPPP